MLFEKERFRKWIEIPLLILVSAAAYLPMVTHFGYFRDDWYLMYAANAMGGHAFHEIFAIDRPMRAYVMSALYSIFGLNPLYYNISLYVFRVIGALTFLWILRQLWPRQRSATMTAGILFLIYPGFLSWPNAIDYQSHLSGLMAGMISIALTWKTLLARGFTAKIFLFLASVLLGFFYLSQIEWYLGLEAFRLCVVALHVTHSSNLKSWNWLGQTCYKWSPFAVAPLAFIVWRFYFFTSERKATDLGAQFGRFLESPLLVSVQWIKTLLQDSFEVLVLSWGVPLSDLWNTSIRLRELAIAGILIIVVVVIILWMFKVEKRDDEETTDHVWWTEAFWLGLICVVAGFIPVILSNREANFGRLSRYMLVSSSGAVIFIAALIDQFRLRNARLITTCLLVSVSILTHYFNGISWSYISDGMRNFWWQVSWRIPQIEQGTTLVANYSTASVEEDYFVWGPANLIYYPQSTNAQELRPALSSLVLSPESIFAFQTQGEMGLIDRRSIVTFIDYHHALILTQPTPSSCVQVIDGSNPVLSEFEQYDIRSIAAVSDPDLILLDHPGMVPPKVVFGPEPEQTWCYYYEKASLAYQQQDWSTVIQLGQEAQERGYAAMDPVEWMPFMQAAAILGDRDTIMDLASYVKRSASLNVQACNVFAAMPEPDEEMKAFLHARFCN